MHGFVRHQDMRRTRIRIRIDRHGLDAHLPRRADDAACNFATVRDQDLGDCHLYPCPSPYADVRPEQGLSEVEDPYRRVLRYATSTSSVANQDERRCFLFSRNGLQMPSAAEHTDELQLL